MTLSSYRSNQSGSRLEAVLLFSVWLRTACMQAVLKSYPLQKNLLATPLSVLFLLCQSRYVLFLLGCCVFFYFCCTRDIAGPVPVLRSPLNTGLRVSRCITGPLKGLSIVSVLPVCLDRARRRVTLCDKLSHLVTDRRHAHADRRALATREPLLRSSTSQIRWPA